MAAATEKVVTFEAPIEKVYQAITDYRGYVDFVEGVSEVDIKEETEKGALVEYSINMIKKVRYTLRMTHQKPTQVTWALESGDLFKKNEGFWKLKDNGDGTTEVTYNVSIDIKGFIPMASKIVSSLTEGQLPKMLKSYEQRAQSL